MTGRRLTLPLPSLMLVTDSRRRHGREADQCASNANIVREAVLGGVHAVQLRERHLSSSELIDLGARLRDAIGARALLFVNGDVDAAMALGADGIHLPASGPTIADARARAGGDVLISVAVHDLPSAQRAERDGADLVVLGTIFETPLKAGRATIGVDGVREVCAAVRLPVLAIGGITAENAAEVMRAGASGAAVIGAIFDALDARAAAVALRAEIDGAVSP